MYLSLHSACREVAARPRGRHASAYPLHTALRGGEKASAQPDTRGECISHLNSSL